jgi:hypothetical protein
MWHGSSLQWLTLDNILPMCEMDQSRNMPATWGADEEFEHLTSVMPGGTAGLPGHTVTAAPQRMRRDRD